MAHPDDSDFGAGGTIAQWTESGIEVSYCIITNGDQGGEESGIPLEEMPKVRQKEQRDALRVSTLSQIASALELYYSENKKYPTALFSSVIFF